jgi:hypothetical protein
MLPTALDRYLQLPVVDWVELDKLRPLPRVGTSARAH